MVPDVQAMNLSLNPDFALAGSVDGDSNAVLQAANPPAVAASDTAPSAPIGWHEMAYLAYNAANQMQHIHTHYTGVGDRHDGDLYDFKVSLEREADWLTEGALKHGFSVDSFNYSPVSPWVSSFPCMDKDDYYSDLETAAAVDAVGRAFLAALRRFRGSLTDSGDQSRVDGMIDQWSVDIEYKNAMILKGLKDGGCVPACCNTESWTASPSVQLKPAEGHGEVKVVAVAPGLDA